MPLGERLVNDGPLQREIQTFLRQRRPPAQLQRVPCKKLKRAIQKALESTRAETRAVNQYIWAAPQVCWPPYRSGPRSSRTPRQRQVQKPRRDIPYTTRIRFRITQRDRQSSPRPSQL